MTFSDQFAYGNAPERTCPDKFGGLLAVFKPGVLEGHERAGYTFRPNACVDAIAYDPDYCVPGDVKMDPGRYGPGKDAILGMIQTAINCPLGVTLDELRDDARQTLLDNIERAIEADFVAFLDTLATAQGGPFQAKCVLAEAAQYLSDTSECGRGLIAGPVKWFVQLENTLVWQAAKGYHTDFVGNIVIPHSVNNDTVYALDKAIEIKISDVQLLDELVPGITSTNDRVVRAEQLYTVAVDSCEIGSFAAGPCCEC